MAIDGIVDTSIFIDYLRRIPDAQQWLLTKSNATLAITPVVWMEVVQGARNKMERAQYIRFLRQFSIEHPTILDNQWAMRQFAQFHLSHGIEMADVMIASVAVRLGTPLYTLNVRHYISLSGIKVQRPY